MNSQLNSVSVFSGIGGISIGNPLLYVEKDYHCQRVLHARIADGCLKAAPIHSDIKTLEKLPAGCDILQGGSPCQDFSAAGLKKGVLDGQRSVLFFEMTRLAAASRPKYIFFENVSNLRNLESSWKTMLLKLHQIGYNCRWCECSAEMASAHHQRLRWFMLCKLARDADETAELVLNGLRMYQNGELIDGKYSPTAKIVADFTPAISITLIPLEGPKKCKSTNLITKPVKRKRWATCRAYGGSHPARGLTKRCSADLATMLRFAQDTPENERWGDHIRPNADWLDSFMGFPVGWSNYNESVQHDSHSFIENRKIPRLIISNIPNSHRLKMLGNACCPQQAAFAFAELWRRSTIEIPPPEMLSFPLPDIRQGKRKRTGSICKHCNGSGVL